MKLKIRYSTKEREPVSPHSYRHVSKDAELAPVAIYRSSVGSNGAARKRFYYKAEFVAPDDAAFTIKGKLFANIVRKDNKHFKPSDLVFVNNVCMLGGF